mgnify:FL=1
MNSSAMSPYGLALAAYFQGKTDAELVIRRDDGVEASLPARHFFRPEAEFTSIELAAVEHCRGDVLDIGAGAGLHSLALQSRGLPVTAIDISAEAADIMLRRGVRTARQADVFEYRGGPFDTLVMLGHGVGIVEDLGGLHRFLTHAKELVKPTGQLLVDSLDVSRSREPEDLAYQEANRKAGRFRGEVVMQIEFGDTKGPFCGWLHVDPETLEDHAMQTGWTCETILELANGEYLARLQTMGAS